MTNSKQVPARTKIDPRKTKLKTKTPKTSSNLLLIAPHGRNVPRKDDEYTAEITEEIAETLGCHAIINKEISRHVLDFNKISEAQTHDTFIPSIKK